MNSLVHPVRGYVLLQLQCYMPGAFPVCHPLYAAHYVAWHSGSSVARRHVEVSVAMARRCAAAAVAPSVAWRHVAASVAMARHCTAAAGAPSVAAAALVRVAAVTVKS